MPSINELRRWSATAFFSAALIGLTDTAHSQVTIDGGEFSTATWTAAESPYVVSQETSYEELTVQAGTMILFDAEHAGRLILRVQTLVVSGTEAEPVVFDATAEPEHYNWTISTQHVEIEGALVRRAHTAFSIYGSQTSNFRKSSFEASGTGIETVATNGTLDVDRARFIGVGLGVYFRGNAANFSNTLFVQSGLDAVACNGGTCSFSHCTFDQNQFGVYADGGQVVMRNSLVTNNVFGLMQSDGDLDVTDSNFWNNDFDATREQGVGSEIELDAGFAVDPQYVGRDDWRLSPESECIDAVDGDGVTVHDLDGNARPQDGDGNPSGTEFDLGAYEAPRARGGQRADDEAADGGNVSPEGGAATPPTSEGPNPVDTPMNDGGGLVADAGLSANSDDSGTLLNGDAAVADEGAPNAGREAADGATESADDSISQIDGDGMNGGVEAEDDAAGARPLEAGVALAADQNTDGVRLDEGGGGCGCRVASSDSFSTVTWAWLAGLALALRRTRSKCKVRSPGCRTSWQS